MPRLTISYILLAMCPFSILLAAVRWYVADQEYQVQFAAYTTLFFWMLSLVIVYGQTKLLRPLLEKTNGNATLATDLRFSITMTTLGLVFSVWYSAQKGEPALLWAYLAAVFTTRAFFQLDRRRAASKNDDA
ncbi:MAG: hypothetical protein AAF483_22800 [Planctomycetota bacterium]